MDEERSLLAYLVPKITNQREDTATDALAFILNKSQDCRRAFNELLRTNGYALDGVGNFRTQVDFGDGYKPDMVGYDEHRKERLIVESKFWASLRHGQTKGYFSHLEESGTGILLYIAPGARMETLWAEIARRMKEDGLPLESVKTDGQMLTAEIADTGKRLMLVSWVALLDRLKKAVPNDSPVASDISQLRSLALREDEEAFQPIADEELSPSIAHRFRGLNQLIDDAIIAHGIEQGWVSSTGANAAPQRSGYGRYFNFADADGRLFLGVNFWLWATYADTPIWLEVNYEVQVNAPQLRDAVPSLVEGTEWWPYKVPIYLKTGVEYEDVLDDVAHQLKQIHNTLQPNKK